MDAALQTGAMSVSACSKLKFSRQNSPSCVQRVEGDHTVVTTCAVVCLPIYSMESEIWTKWMSEWRGRLISPRVCAVRGEQTMRRVILLITRLIGPVLLLQQPLVTW